MIIRKVVPKVVDARERKSALSPATPLGVVQNGISVCLRSTVNVRPLYVPRLRRPASHFDLAARSAVDRFVDESSALGPASPRHSRTQVLASVILCLRW